MRDQEIGKQDDIDARTDSDDDRSISIIGACVNEGQDWYSGVQTAPRVLRDSGLIGAVRALGYEVFDEGDVTVNDIVPDDEVDETVYYRRGSIKNAGKLGDSCGKLHESVLAACSRQNRNFVLTIGGDHGVAVGSISALKRAKKDISVVWVDAHADCNIPETSPSGNFHGMPLGLLLGWFSKKAHPRFDWIDEYLTDPLQEHRVAYIGLRDVDEGERKLLRNSKILVYSMTDVDRLGIATVMEQIVEKLSPGGCRPIHLSFDVDGVDPAFAPGTGTRARGGLSYREARYICTRLAETGRLESMDLVEINPTLDVGEEAAGHEHGDNPHVSAKAPVTVKLGIDLVEFSLGKTLC